MTTYNDAKPRPRTSSGTRIKTRKRVGGILLTVLTWMLALLFFFPVAWMVLTAFKSEPDAVNVPPTLFSNLSFDQFGKVFSGEFANYLINSLMASIISTVIVIVLAALAAYGLSIRSIKKPTDVLFFFISTKFMPVAAAIIPIYLLIQGLGLLDNINMLAVMYVSMNLPIAIWMMRSFFAEVPEEIIEAAQIDGASFRIEFFRVVLPLVAPGIAAASLICFIFAWNEFFYATVLTSNIAKTAPIGLTGFIDGRGQYLAVLAAASTVAVIPVVLAGWFAQKRLVRGLAMGAIK